MNIRAALALAVLLSGAGCEFMNSSSGGSETTNGLTGLVQGADGTAMANMTVYLVPEGYDPVPSENNVPFVKMKTDSNGRYRFEEIPSGNYSLEVEDSASGRKARVTGLEITRNQPAGPDVNVTLRNTGVLSIPFADRTLPQTTRLFVPGSMITRPFSGSVNANGFLVFPGLAEGDYSRLMAYFPDTSGHDRISITKSFHITSGDTTRLSPLQPWNNFKAFALDLYAAGGLPPDSFSGYPLLVRLDSTHLKFSEALGRGEDIRFAQLDGTLLPHQIERWDSAANEATVWVRLDSLPRTGDSLAIHWGRVDAVDRSTGSQVFDTAQGFRAVWHLGEAANNAVNGYPDATRGAVHATASSINPGSDTQAVAGIGKRFQESGGHLTASMPAGLGGNGSFSVTFWMKFGMAPFREGILFFGEETMLKGFHFLIRRDTTAQFGPWDSTPNAEPSGRQNHFSLVPYLGIWTHIATVYDAAQQTLTTYVNGEAAAVNPLSLLDLQIAPGVRIGRGVTRDVISPGESNLNGILDEIRIYGRAISQTLVRVEFETQKPGAVTLRTP